MTTILLTRSLNLNNRFHTNVYNLAPENEFPENISLKIFSIKFVVICAAKILQVG